ncbi:MAG: hypothetical protein ACR2PK_07835, partial [Acidimicrobiales bacterium]
MNVILGAIAFGGAVMILFWAVGGRRQTVEGVVETNVRTREMSESGFQRVMLPVLTRLGRQIARWLPAGRIQTMRHRIIHAGLQRTWNVEKAMAYKALFAIIGLFAAYAVLYRFGVKRETVVVALVIVAWGLFCVDYWLDRKASARQLEIQQALPDVLDQISVCVEAGLGFDAALQ